MAGNRIAVIGAGNGGYAMAADLTLAGYEISLYEMPQFRQNLEPILHSGGIELSGIGRRGFAQVSKATTDIAEALRGARLILVTTQALAHETIAELCAPHLEKGQTVVLFPGNFGSLLFRKKLREKGVHQDIKIAETTTFPYGCRRVLGQARVHIHLFLISPIAALPARDTPTVMEEVKQIYPEQLSAASNVLEVALSNPNLWFHMPLCILNYRTIEASGGDFYPFKEGLSPSVFRLIEAVVREKDAILHALGLTDRFPYRKFKEDYLLSPPPGALTIQYQDRFFSEDCPCSLVPLASLGDMLGVPTPITKALLALASEIRGTDYFTGGRTMERLGIAGLNIKELRQFLG